MSGKRPVRIAIIGGGLSGITMAINIKKHLKVDTFTIYEKNTAPGGTWRDNTYPNCACDVPSHWYSLSTEPNPYWSHTYSPQPEIQRYWVGIHKKHNLGAHTQYDSSFKSAYWDGQRQVYVITFERQSDKSITYEVEAEVLISAIGGFSTPLDAPPSLKGLLDFKGERFHSARWNHDAVLAGKRVGVIGNGCSGAQFIPKISEDPSSTIINFSRTPSWFYPRSNVKYSGLTKAIFAYVPGVMKGYRAIQAGTHDSRWLAWRLDLPFIRHYAEEIAVKHILDTAPPKYHDFLLPKYPFGCKRIILDPGYLESLNRPNVELVTTGIDTITETGIRLKDGTDVQLDVLILATGFDVSARGLGINVKGTTGQTVTQQWEDQQGPQAYLGTTIANFPNFFTLLGPNVATGHASVISSTESQVNYVVEMIRPLVEKGVQSFTLKTDAEDRYNVNLRKRLSNTVWSGSCNSYYKLPNGKVIATFPGTLTELWLRTRTPNFEHYLQRGGKRSVALMARLKSVFRFLLFVLAIVGIRRYGVQRLRNEALLFALQRYQDVVGLIRRD